MDQPSIPPARSKWTRGVAAELMQRYLPQLERFATRRLGPELRQRESPTDIVQSACREVLESLDSFDDFGDGELAFKKWLYRSTLRKLRDRRRFHRRLRRDAGREVHCGSESQWAPGTASRTPSRAAIAEENRDLIHRAMTQLPQHYREVIQLSHLDGLPATEVSRRLGKSCVAVHSLLARALARLAQLLRAEAGPGSFGTRSGFTR